MHGVAVAAHDTALGRDVVGEDPIAPFACELGFGVLDDVVGLGRKANNEVRSSFRVVRHCREDVGIFGECELRSAAGAFLNLV